VVTAFGKKIGDSLVTFGLCHQIVKNDQVPFAGVDVLGIIQVVGDTVYKFYPRYSTLKFVIQRLPLSETPYDAFRRLTY
jgi:hypothetical protein